MQGKRLIVMKFGGTSVGNAERFRQCAAIIGKAARHDRIVVVVSAMAGVTDLIGRHRPLRVIDVFLPARWLRGVPVATEIAADDGEPFGEPRRDLVPHRVRLWIAMQHEERRSDTADHARDFCALRRDAA